jgi:hypothetical protein
VEIKGIFLFIYEIRSSIPQKNYLTKNKRVNIILKISQANPFKEI